MSKSNGITSPVCPYMVNTVIVWVQKDVVFKIVSWEVGRILEMFVKLNIFSSDVFLTARGRGGLLLSRYEREDNDYGVSELPECKMKW